MNPRKWITLVTSAASIALLSFGLASAQEEKKEATLHELMEQVSGSNNKLNRMTRTKVTFTKASNGKDIAKEAAILLDLTKKSRDKEDALEKAKDEKDPKKKWLEFMDTQIKQIDELIKVSEAGDFDKTKAAHNAVKTTCADCHKIFHKEDDF